MAKQNSFDIVSQVDFAEVTNAVNQASKEIHQRFDFKGSSSNVEFDKHEGKLVLVSADEFRLQAVDQIVQQKLARRGVSLKALTHGKIEPSAKGSVRQTVTLQQGIPIEKAREIVKIIKGTKLKVQSAINDDQIRVTSKVRDTLQEVMAILKDRDFDIDMQFTNYRSQ